MRQRVIVCLSFLLSAFSAHAADDNVIRVLGVLAADADLGDAIEQLDNLVLAWDDSDIQSTVGIQLANSGVPVLTPFVFNGTDSQILATAESLQLWNDLRELFAADVMILFTDEIDAPPGSTPGTVICGFARQVNWTKQNGSAGLFSQGSNGLDLNGSENGYAAIVADEKTGGVCADPFKAGHELGHLLGGGHTEDPIGTSLFYLFGDSYAVSPIFSVPFFGTVALRSVIAEPSPTNCVDYFNQTGKVCQQSKWYSTTTRANFGDGWRQSAYNCRQVKRAHRQTQQMKRSTSRDALKKAQRQQVIVNAHRDYVALARQFIEKSEQTLAAEAVDVDLPALAKAVEIQRYICHAERQMEQIERRVIHGKTIAHVYAKIRLFVLALFNDKDRGNGLVSHRRSRFGVNPTVC